MKLEHFTDGVTAFSAAHAALYGAAQRLVQAGERTAAGLLLVLCETIKQDENWYRLTLKVSDGAAPAPVSPAARELAGKCRHDFRDAHGIDAETCLLCGAKKSARGRKRTQTVIAPSAKQRAPLPGAKPCTVGDGTHVPGADASQPFCIRCGQPVFKVSDADAG